MLLTKRVSSRALENRNLNDVFQFGCKGFERGECLFGYSLYVKDDDYVFLSGFYRLLALTTVEFDEFGGLLN